MAPLWTVLVLLGGLSLYAMMGANQATEQTMRIRGEVYATQFLAYHRAVINYQNQNVPPLAAGAIPDAALNVYLPKGYVPNGMWANFVENGIIYVYSVLPDNGRLASGAAYRMSDPSRLIGQKDPATGRLILGQGGGLSAVVLPNVIPNDALVIVGR